MTATLKANRTMKDEAARRQLTTLLQHLRSKIEGDPKRYGGVMKKLERAEASVLDGHMLQARDQIIEVEGILDEKDQAAATQAQMEEQERLAEARNQPTAKADSGVATRDGFLWLKQRGRFTPARVEAGRIFREKYSRAYDTSLPSCIAGSNGGSDGGLPPSGHHARFEIDGVRKHMSSSVGNATGEALFALLVAVVGKGETVRHLAGGNDRKAEVKVIELGLALDLAGVYLGAVRT